VTDPLTTRRSTFRRDGGHYRAEPDPVRGWHAWAVIGTAIGDGYAADLTTAIDVAIGQAWALKPVRLVG